MQRSPKDDMFADFSRCAQARYKPSLQLCLGERRDRTFEGILVILPTFEDTRLCYFCSCHLLCSLHCFVCMHHTQGLYKKKLMISHLPDLLNHLGDGCDRCIRLIVLNIVTAVFRK